LRGDETAVVEEEVLLIITILSCLLQPKQLRWFVSKPKSSFSRSGGYAEEINMKLKRGVWVAALIIASSKYAQVHADENVPF
jgi:hypothetical protein